ncbi:hypothetical protein G3I76_65470 [Streptomyces sp. SID11233]|nr:hypothetical protein [Streptomyces sp. SID11233]
MGDLWRVEIEPEVGEPYARHLGGKVRELRFSMDGNAVRITYLANSACEMPRTRR